MPPEDTVAQLPPVSARPLVTVAIPAREGAAFTRVTTEGGCRWPLSAEIADFDAVNPVVWNLGNWLRLLKQAAPFGCLRAVFERLWLAPTCQTG